MGKTKKNFVKNSYSNPFASPWANPKHAHSQVNGQSQQTQDLIILENIVKKNP